MASPTTGLRIFVVDDEPIIASTVATILTLHGLSATPFTDPLQALKAARIEIPDLLISDVVMFTMSGVDLAIQIREEHPSCKVLLFSGQATTADLLWSAQARGHEFEVLLKPVHPTDLLARVKNVIEMQSSSRRVLAWPN
jgi:DNA-binding NtrC family response regulator